MSGASAVMNEDNSPTQTNCHEPARHPSQPIQRIPSSPAQGRSGKGPVCGAGYLDR